MALLRLVYGRGIVCCVEPKQRDVDDPNAVEVDEQMPERTLLVIRLEKCAVPVDAVETHETLCWWNVDQTSLTKKYQGRLVQIVKVRRTLSVSTMRAIPSGYQNSWFTSS